MDCQVKCNATQHPHKETKAHESESCFVSHADALVGLVSASSAGIFCVGSHRYGEIKQSKGFVLVVYILCVCVQFEGTTDGGDPMLVIAVFCEQ